MENLLFVAATLFMDGWQSPVNVIPPDSLGGFHIFHREHAAVFQFAVTKIEEQSHGRARGFQVVDDLHHLIVCELMTECFDLHHYLQVRE